MKDQSENPISAARGRPLLSWVGKRPLRSISAFPAQHVETFDPVGLLSAHGALEHWPDWPEAYPQGGLLFHGDNKEVLAHLLANGFRSQIKLVYIDPPFDSGANYARRVRLRGAVADRLEGASYSLGEQVQYADIWASDSYLQFMYERLLLLRELLADDGSIYLHCDYRKVHHLRCVMDEVFGADRFQNEIIWFYPRGGDSERQFNRKHDTILFYTKGDTWTFNYHDVLTPYTPEQLARFDQEDEKGRFYWNVNPRGERVKTYLRKRGIGAYDVWTIGIDAAQIQQIGYPTLKPEALLERIIRASSNPGDLVLDCFLGAGTTAAVAQKLRRRWIGCDINRGAIYTTAKRLYAIITRQLVSQSQGSAGEAVHTPGAQSMACTLYRVNHYDLAIQQNEAVDLVCRHIGIERTRSDHFFDGTLGRQLTKIVAFDHPLTPEDLEELSRELAARPHEDRDIVLVCLGKESAADDWLERWNHPGNGARAVNRIAIIELRSDPKYGKFIAYQPATAQANVRRSGEKLVVTIEDFISPTVINRLSLADAEPRNRITDWRQMVDCVMIDPVYDGATFHVTICDAPDRASELVHGIYELPAPPANTTVAIKIIDVLGEEVLLIKQA